VKLTARQYGTLGLAGVGAFVVAMIALHFLDPDLSVMDKAMSEYALGRYGWLERAAEVGLGVGSIGVALGLRQTLAAGKRATASWVLILIAGLDGILSGLFPTDPEGAAETTTAGTIHGTASFVTLLSLLIAPWLLRGAFTRDARYRRLARAQLWFAILMSVSAGSLFLLYQGPAGLLQRLFVVVGVSWLVFLAVNLRQVASTGYVNQRG
jgi:hypothetical protein